MTGGPKYPDFGRPTSLAGHIQGPLVALGSEVPLAKPHPAEFGRSAHDDDWVIALFLGVGALQYGQAIDLAGESEGLDSGYARAYQEENLEEFAVVIGMVQAPEEATKFLGSCDSHGTGGFPGPAGN